MILFEELWWKNFLSTGNQSTIIQLNKAPTTLVLGVNGSGKSTMLDALCYALYKKPFRKIKKDQIVNTINGADCVCGTKFKIGTHEYKVTRGIEPDFMELLIDGKPRPHLEAAKKDDQKYLEEDILKVDYDSFIQIVILGNAKYVPFMQLSKGDRRSFIEQVLNIGVFSWMNEILGNRQKENKNILDAVQKDILVVKEQISLVEGFITKLKAELKKAEQDSQRQINEQNQIIDGMLPSIQTLTQQIEEQNEKLTQETMILNEECDEKVDALEKNRLTVQTYISEIEKYKSLRSGIARNIETAQEKIDFYEQNDTCKACGQEIAVAHKDGILCERKAKIKELNEGLKKIDIEIAKWKTTLQQAKENNQEIDEAVRKLNLENQVAVRKLTSEMQVSIRMLTGDLQTKQSTVSAARKFIKKLEDDMKKSPGNLQEQEEKLIDFQSKLTEHEEKKEEAVETRHYYDVAALLLKDNGIKAAIIKQYLPTINKLVNKYLNALDCFLSFELDENFSESFKSRFRDTLQYASFSEGEKLRIDLSLLFTWREVARMKNSCSTNLLILDEVIDKSLDYNGTDYFIKLLNDLGDTSNVFVISHKNEAALDRFTDVLRFEKTKNFSHLVDEA